MPDYTNFLSALQGYVDRNKPVATTKNDNLQEICSLCNKEAFADRAVRSDGFVVKLMSCGHWILDRVT